MQSTPFDEMNRMFEQMDRAFGDMRARWTRDQASGESGGLSGLTNGLHGVTHRMTHDWQTTDEAHTLVVDLPGFEREELDVHVADGAVVIDAEHDAGENATRGRRVHERLSLPADADAEDVHATYRNGVLELAFGRTHESGRRIDIE